MKLQRALFAMCCAATVMLCFVVMASEAQASQISQSDKSGVLRAEMSDVVANGAGATGNAAYIQANEPMMTKKKLRVSMSGLDPSTSYDVLVDDVMVGTMMTNKKGKGHFLATAIETSRGGSRGGLPTIGPGSVVRVGNAVGVLN